MEDYSRRHVIKTSLWTFGALCLGLPGVIAAAREPRNSTHGLLSWDEFVDQLEQRAKAQHSYLWDQTSYVGSVAALLHGLDPSDPTLRRTAALRGSPTFTKPDFAELLKTTDVQISLITFEKGESLPHHDHPSMTGVLTCATGDLAVESYDRIQSPPEAATSPILLKRLGADIIRPGKISTLTNTRRNIHFVKALSFTQVIDIFTPPYDADRTSKTSWFRVDQRPLRGREEVFVAHPY